MPTVSWHQMKQIWPYSLGSIPFIAVFAYELAVVFPHRPLAPDPAHGYTIAMGIDHKTVYISAGDSVLLFGAWLCTAAVVLTGLWRIGMFQRFFPR